MQKILLAAVAAALMGLVPVASGNAAPASPARVTASDGAIVQARMTKKQMMMRKQKMMRKKKMIQRGM